MGAQAKKKKETQVQQTSNRGSNLSGHLNSHHGLDPWGLNPRPPSNCCGRFLPTPLRSPTQAGEPGSPTCMRQRIPPQRPPMRYANSPAPPCRSNDHPPWARHSSHAAGTSPSESLGLPSQAHRSSRAAQAPPRGMATWETWPFILVMPP